jgi:hypothetical protein
MFDPVLMPHEADVLTSAASLQTLPLSSPLSFIGLKSIEENM